MVNKCRVKIITEIQRHRDCTEKSMLDDVSGKAVTCRIELPGGQLLARERSVRDIQPGKIEHM